MGLVPNDPLRHLARMRRDFDRFFSEFPATIEGQFFPGGIRVDVHETESHVIAVCDIPGIGRKEDIHVEVFNNTLTISGTADRTSEMKAENMFRRERHAGKFRRTVRLPSPVEEDGVSATYRNGVLKVRMVKRIIDDKKPIDVKFD